MLKSKILHIFCWFLQKKGFQETARPKNSLDGSWLRPSIHLTRWTEDSVAVWPEPARDGSDAIYLPLLVLHHNAWSTQKEM